VQLEVDIGGRRREFRGRHALFVFAGLAYEIGFFSRYYGTLN
jgi:hypothetical protein